MKNKYYTCLEYPTFKIPSHGFNHTKKRLKERYKVSIDEKEYVELCKQVEDSFICRKYSKNRDQRITTFKEVIVKVGYNKKRKIINTVLYSNRKELRGYKEYKNK